MKADVWMCFLFHYQQLGELLFIRNAKKISKFHRDKPEVQWRDGEEHVSIEIIWNSRNENRISLYGAWGLTASSDSHWYWRIRWINNKINKGWRMGDWFIAGNMLSLQGFSHFGANFPMKEGHSKKVCVNVWKKCSEKCVTLRSITHYKVHERLTQAKSFYLASQPSHRLNSIIFFIVLKV